LIVMAIGYAHGLLFVYHTTGITPHGVEERYRGNQQQMQQNADPPQEEMKFEKSLPEMLNIIHTHIISMGTMFFITSIIFAFCSLVSGAWKKFLLVEPFIAILTSFGSMWLMWKVNPLFSWLLMLSSGSMAVVFYITIYYSFRELMMKPGMGTKG
ncbi:MAG TPA: hypothetical protein VFA55_10230, partial [Candidatus Kapabacteria bacterium]|nr:hypothetical protein [Candidatus Kapabacteria bacterium]